MALVWPRTIYRTRATPPSIQVCAISMSLRATINSRAVVYSWLFFIGTIFSVFTRIPALCHEIGLAHSLACGYFGPLTSMKEPDIASEEGFEVKAITGQPRYCRHCERYKPPRSK
jgi:hypothetical protein